MTPTRQNSIREAQRALDANQYERAAELLDALIEEDDPEALFLRSQFSVPAQEDADSFNRRHLRQLEEADELGHAGAAYQLSIYFEEGDLVPQDCERALQLLRRAADRGHPHAIWRVGVMLLYGTGGYKRDVVGGVALIERAAALKSQGALRDLASFYAKGLYGFPQDTERADHLASAAEADDTMAI